jgi:hypothetical protein
MSTEESKLSWDKNVAKYQWESDSLNNLDELVQILGKIKEKFKDSPVLYVSQFHSFKGYAQISFEVARPENEAEKLAREQWEQKKIAISAAREQITKLINEFGLSDEQEAQIVKHVMLKNSKTEDPAKQPV